MLEFARWLQEVRFADKPWLLVGKGPTFARRGEFDLDAYHCIGLNHVVRELPVDVAHVIDVDVLPAIADALPRNAQWLLMPRHPHVDCRPDPQRPLESFFDAHPVLRDFAARGRLVWYDLRSKSCPVHGSAAPIKARFFSSEAALRIVARLGGKVVRTLGVDGGRSYAGSFRDAEATRLANQQPSFDLQFGEFDAIAKETGLDVESLIPPMRIFIGGDESEHVAAKVLEHTIRQHASGPVAITIMRDYAIPTPKDPANRARTKFSFYRFRIPELCRYRDRALYVDSDMQVFRDVAELWRLPFGARKILCTRQDSPPAAWRDHSWFKPGRQFSVMLLDCERLPWRVEDVVRGLDEGRYKYANLMFEMCLVAPDEIGDDLPTAWNHLETYVPGETALTHFTVVPTQPWKTDATPLNDLWMRAYEDAVAAGAVDPRQVREGIRRGWYKRGLEAALAKAPAFWSWTDPDAAPAAAADTGLEADRLRRQLRELRASWTWRLGRLFTRPLDLLRRGGAQRDASA
ncbi:MAG: glycosyltransferase [Planctomycetota bacterium]